MSAKDYTCIHEDLIQDHSLKLKGLETKSDYKEARIDELYTKIDKMEQKIDLLNENVNKLILQSSKDDQNLEIRLAKIETELEQQKNTAQRRTVWIGIGLTILTILINLYFQMIH